MGAIRKFSLVACAWLLTAWLAGCGAEQTFSPGGLAGGEEDAAAGGSCVNADCDRLCRTVRNAPSGSCSGGECKCASSQIPCINDEGCLLVTDKPFCEPSLLVCVECMTNNHCKPGQDCLFNICSGGGGQPDAGRPDSGGGCTPATCQSKGAECGSIADGCGNFIECGSCQAPDTCAGGGQPNRCGKPGDPCKPLTCIELGAECGPASNGCGASLNCGTCPAGKTCNARQKCEDETPPPPSRPDPVCSEDGWCWSNPLPQGNTIHGLHAFAPDNILAVGEGGTTLRWDGRKWNWIKRMTREPLYAVWGSSPNNAWAVGASGTALRWNGVSWSEFTKISNEHHVRLWGTGPDDIWAVGETAGLAAAVRRWNGKEWLFNPPTFLKGIIRGVWGSGKNSVYVSGDGMALWNGNSWERVNLPATGRLNAIWGANADDIWAVGENGFMVHYDGLRWNFVTPPIREDMKAITGTASNNIYAVSEKGSVLHYDGAAWKVIPSTGTSGWNALAIAGANDVWTAGPYGAMARGGLGGLRQFHVSATPNSLRGVWAVTPNEVIAVGDRGTILRWDGREWKQETAAGSPGLYGAWGSAANNLWITGTDGYTSNWNGSAWKKVPTGSTAVIRSIWGKDAQNVWAVGDKGVLLTLKSGAWELDTQGDQPWYSILGNSKEVWVGGHQGASLYMDYRLPDQWYGSAAPIDKSTFYGIWPDNFGNVWAATTRGVYGRNATARWEYRFGPQRTNAVWSNGTDVWGAGDFGFMSRVGIQAGQPVSQDTACYHKITGLGGWDGVFWAVGEYGMVLRRQE
ncbi:MAG: hypothetical protein GMKNLPBB_02208 [Myxococcota bacterium]|nr:hypothetical protein [Myxococcota bacterium]